MYFAFAREGVYGAWNAFLIDHPVGRLLVAALFVNISGGAVLQAVRSLRRPRLNLPYLKSMDISAQFAIQSGEWDTRMQQWLASKGFVPVVRKNRGGYSVKGRWSFLPQLLLRCGILLLLFGFLASHASRRVEEHVLTLGSADPIDQDSPTLVSLDLNMPPTHLQVGRERNFSLHGVMAQIRVGDRTIAVHPGWGTKVYGKYYRISDVGYLQTFRASLKDQSSQETVRLNLLPPGREENITLYGEPTRISLAPSRTVTKGRLTGNLYDLVSPSFLVATAGRKPVVLGAGVPVRMPSGILLEKGDSSYWVRIQTVRDWGLPFFRAGLPVTGVGLLLLLTNFFWYRKEIVYFEDGGDLLVGYAEQYLKKWGIQRFYGWKEEMDGLLSIKPSSQGPATEGPSMHEK